MIVVKLHKQWPKNCAERRQFTFVAVLIQQETLINKFVFTFCHYELLADPRGGVTNQIKEKMP